MKKLSRAYDGLQSNMFSSKLIPHHRILSYRCHFRIRFEYQMFYNLNYVDIQFIQTGQTVVFFYFIEHLAIGLSFSIALKLWRKRLHNEILTLCAYETSQISIIIYWDNRLDSNGNPKKKKKQRQKIKIKWKSS